MVSLPPPMNGESLHREMQATLPKPVVATPLHLLTHTRVLMTQQELHVAAIGGLGGTHTVQVGTQHRQGEHSVT